MLQTADTFRRHGGRLAAAQAAFPNAPRPWLDLSTGINPHGWPARRLKGDGLRRLPDPADLAALETAAAAAFGAPARQVVATAGADAALRLLPILTGARSVGIVSPTYGGHAQAWRAAGAQVIEADAAALGRRSVDAVVIVNPNNPDGAVQDPVRWADDSRWQVVDESFAETRPQISVAGHGLTRTIVLRSFGKFYGLPGLRLGFLIAPEPVADRARLLLGDWPVSAEAIAIGRAAYADTAWADRTRRRLERAARRLDSLLARSGFEVVGGTSLFRLARAGDAQRRFCALAQRGVLTRPFGHDETVLRFGLPPDRQWGRLAAALDDL